LLEAVPMDGIALVCYRLILKSTIMEACARKLKMSLDLNYPRFAAPLGEGSSLGRQYGLTSSSGEPLSEPPYTGPL
jgi:hypothetical protein